MNLKELIFGEGVHTGGSGGVYRDSVQAWLPIKNIIGGVVITKDNRFVKIMEVLPVNIYLKSAIDRQNIISSFASYLQIAPDELQMIARTLPADTQAYVEQMQRYAEQEENEACREMIEDNIREIGHGIAGGAMRHRFSLCFSMNPPCGPSATRCRPSSSGSTKRPTPQGGIWIYVNWRYWSLSIPIILCSSCSMRF